MKITDFETHERLALGGLIRMMIKSDGDFSEQEEEKVNAIGRELGAEDLIWRAVSMSAQECQEDHQVMAVVAQVVRPAVREVIITALEGIAGADGISDDERRLLERLRGAWD